MSADEQGGFCVADISRGSTLSPFEAAYQKHFIYFGYSRLFPHWSSHCSKLNVPSTSTCFNNRWLQSSNVPVGRHIGREHQKAYPFWASAAPSGTSMCKTHNEYILPHCVGTPLKPSPHPESMYKVGRDNRITQAVTTRDGNYSSISILGRVISYTVCAFYHARALSTAALDNACANWDKAQPMRDKRQAWTHRARLPHRFAVCLDIWYPTQVGTCTGCCATWGARLFRK